MGRLSFHIKQVLIALDQLINALLLGFADETLSSRAWRWHLDGKDFARKIIDTLFFWDKEHCKTSYENERQGRHLPPEMR